MSDTTEVAETPPNRPAPAVADRTKFPWQCGTVRAETPDANPPPGPGEFDGSLGSPNPPWHPPEDAGPGVKARKPKPKPMKPAGKKRKVK